MDNTVLCKSKQFAVRIVRLNQYLQSQKQEHTLSKQLLRSGTSIGANVREASQAVSRPDFINKLSIALKESVETEYWLELFVKSDLLNREVAKEIYNECGTIRKMLISSINTAKQNTDK